jgi:hypothetical protein
MVAKMNVLQRNSNLGHVPMIPHQANWGKDVLFRWIGKTVILEKTSCGACLGGVGWDWIDKKVR